MGEFNLKLVFEVLDRATAPMRRIGEAVGRIGRATGLDKVGAATRDVGVGLVRVGREAVRFGSIAAASLSALGGGLFALVKRSAGSADELAKTADKLGVGVGSLQRLEYHAGLSGVATEQLRESIRFLLNAAGETAQGVGAAGDTFARLGISVTDNTGKMKSAEQLMYEVADAIAKVEDPTLRVTIAQDLFGRSGAGMINALKGGSAAMRENGREAERLGIITEDQARASEAFNDNWARLTKVLGHFADMLAADLLPYMNDFLVWLRNIVIEIRPDVVDVLTAAFVDVGIAVRWVVSAWKSATAALGTWLALAAAVSPMVARIVGRMLGFIRTFGLTRTVISLLATALGVKLVVAIAGLFGPLARLAWSLAIVAFRMTMLAAAGVKSLITGLVSMLPTLGGVIAATWAWTAALLANPLTWVVLAVVAAVAALAGAAYLVYRNWDDIVGWFADLWADVQAIFDRNVAWIRETWEEFDPAATVGGWIDGIRDAVATTWAEVREMIREKLGDLGPDLDVLDWGAKAAAWIDDLTEGYATAWADFRARVSGWLAGLTGLPAIVDWTAAATAWVDDLTAGYTSNWSGFREMVSGRLTDLSAVLALVDWTTAGGGWIATLIGGVDGRWGDLPQTLRDRFPGLLEALAELDLTAAGVALVAGLAAGAATRWEAFKSWLSEAVAAIPGLIADTGLGDVGRAWIEQLSDGVAQGWERLRAWLADRVDELLDILPDWVREKIGLDGLRAPSPAPSPSASAVPSALGPGRAQVGGTVRVTFDNAPSTLRVRDVKREPGGVDLAVDTGYALASP